MSDNLLKVETEDAYPSLLELAAENDLEAFRNSLDRDPSTVDEPRLWYSRQKSSSQMSLHHLTPLMVAATYGSVDVLKLILSRPGIDINRSCGADKTTALHCAASSGSIDAVEVVQLLLSAGADPNLSDVNGRRPIDVISVPPKSRNYSSIRAMLSSEDEIPFFEEEKKEYPVDPLMPDIKNGIYSTDEFRMFSFKVRPCSRAYSHDWTECPFVHPGENARRRDPRKFHYSCVPCPEFRKGACRRGDMCEYSHGVFECWLHPAQYRTRLCKDGTSCNRRVCFFAHKQDELRPLYISGVPSPRSIAATSPLMSPSNQNMPALHLPGSSLQSTSRLRSSLNARLFTDIDNINVNLLNRSLRPVTLIAPSNLDDMFSAESSSPRYSDVFSPMHQQQGMLSPIKTAFSPRNVDRSLMLPRHHVDPISPMSARQSMLTRHEFRSLSSRDLGSKAAATVEETWSKWAVTPEELGKLKRSSSFEALDNGEEPDLSWVHSLVKETPQDMKEKSGHRFTRNAGDDVFDGEGGNSNNYEIEQIDQSVLGAWIEQMQLDQLMAQ